LIVYEPEALLEGTVMDDGTPGAVGIVTTTPFEPANTPGQREEMQARTR
jgi:hypothetical protein